MLSLRWSHLFVAWLLLRTAAWVLLATTTQDHPPLDTVEWLAWGREWQLGYHKHPPLAAWLIDLAFRATPGSFAGVYLLGYGFIALGLWAVWRLARHMLPPGPALASVVCLDGLVFVGQAAAEVNNQVPLLAFWALAVYWFHRACATDRWRYWVGTGLALGLGALCKYSIAFLVVPLLAWWLWHHGARRLSRPVIVAAVALAVFLPHLLWLIENDFPTLRYAALRAQGEGPSRWSGLAFLGSQALRLVPIVLILAPLLCLCRRREGPPSDLGFLLTAALGPVALHLLASVALGLRLRDIWGVPLWTFTGLLVVRALQTRDDGLAWRRFGLAWGGVLGGWLMITGWANVSHPLLRTRYPAQQLADEACRQFEQRHGVPPAVIAGDWWLAGSVCCRARHRPMLYGSREPARPGMVPRLDRGDLERFRAPDDRASPWTSDSDLSRRGGLILWDARAFGDAAPAWLGQRFPTARPEAPLDLPSGLRVGWAMVPPQG